MSEWVEENKITQFQKIRKEKVQKYFNFILALINCNEKVMFMEP